LCSALAHIACTGICSFSYGGSGQHINLAAHQCSLSAVVNRMSTKQQQLLCIMKWDMFRLLPVDDLSSPLCPPTSLHASILHA
jgi:hypothetical protein